jgi:hypothetical protein
MWRPVSNHEHLIGWNSAKQMLEIWDWSWFVSFIITWWISRRTLFSCSICFAREVYHLFGPFVKGLTTVLRTYRLTISCMICQDALEIFLGRTLKVKGQGLSGIFKKICFWSTTANMLHSEIPYVQYIGPSLYWDWRDIISLTLISLVFVINGITIWFEFIKHRYEEFSWSVVDFDWVSLKWACMPSLAVPLFSP